MAAEPMNETMEQLVDFIFHTSDRLLMDLFIQQNPEYRGERLDFADITAWLRLFATTPMEESSLDTFATLRNTWAHGGKLPSRLWRSLSQSFTILSSWIGPGDRRTHDLLDSLSYNCALASILSLTEEVPFYYPTEPIHISPPKTQAKFVMEGSLGSMVQRKIWLIDKPVLIRSGTYDNRSGIIDSLNTYRETARVILDDDGPITIPYSTELALLRPLRDQSRPSSSRTYQKY